MLVWYRNATHDLLVGNNDEPPQRLSTAGIVNGFRYEEHCSENVHVVKVFDGTYGVQQQQQRLGGLATGESAAHAYPSPERLVAQRYRYADAFHDISLVNRIGAYTSKHAIPRAAEVVPAKSCGRKRPRGDATPSLSGDESDELERPSSSPSIHAQVFGGSPGWQATDAECDVARADHGRRDGMPAPKRACIRAALL